MKLNPVKKSRSTAVLVSGGLGLLGLCATALGGYLAADDPSERNEDKLRINLEKRRSDKSEPIVKPNPSY
jgi:hypothetical protein